ncbi:MAG: hypothetical protein IH995_06180 [Proteobacteria bacterium]|nr:hypothetical protein [Pseudomonadota bacterium]
MDKFKSMVAGKERLIFTFWIWGIIGLLVLLLLIGLLNVAFGYQIGWPMILLSFLVLGYWVIVSIGIWRSSSAYKGNQVWAILAKTTVVLAALGFILLVISGS